MRKLLFLLLITLISCQAEEVARVDLAITSPQEITLDLTKDEEIKLWTELDLEYDEKPSLVYDFEFIKNNEILIKGAVDPLTASSKKEEAKTTNNNRTHWKFYGKLDGNFIAKEEATYTVKVTLVKNNHPALKINKAEVVIVK